MNLSKKIDELKIEINSDVLLKGNVISTLVSTVSNNEFLIKVLLLLDRNVQNWIIVCPTHDHQTSTHGHHVLWIALNTFPNSSLVLFIIKNCELNFINNKLECFVLSGNLEAFLHIKNFGVLPSLNDSIFYSVLYATLQETASNIVVRDSQICTSGENNFLSIGNPLGTSKRKYLTFPTHQNTKKGIQIKSIAIGPTSTIFVPFASQNSDEHFVFVSGKFGHEHFLTPHLVRTEHAIRCACTCSFHIVMCSETCIYVVGDNSNNQIGCGRSTKFVKNLRQLKDQLLEFPNSIIDCQTSSNHTVIKTKCNFIVAGTNIGQMGQYASRVYGNKLIIPNSFTRLFPPDDSFAKSQYTKVALSDDAIAIYLGSRVKLFFEYREYKFSVDPKGGVRTIKNLAICKPNGSSSTTVLIYTSTIEFFVWTKSTKLVILSDPVWNIVQLNASFSDCEENSFLNDINNHMPHDSSIFQIQSNLNQFSCSYAGEFFFIDNWVLYSGQLSSLKGKMECHVTRAYDTPGYVDQIFLSNTGNNVAYSVKKNVSKQNYIEKRYLFERLRLFDFAQSQTTPFDKSQFVENVGRSGSIFVHIFMLRIRIPTILSKLNENNQFALTLHSLRSLREYVEFIYTGTCESLLIACGEFSEHMKRMLINDGICDVCGFEQPLMDLVDQTGRCNERACLAQSTLDYTDVEFIEALDNQLSKLIILAKELGYYSFLTMLDSASQALSQNFKDNIAFTSPCYFIHPSVTNLDDVFCESIVILSCSDGSTQFYEPLLKQISYFETYFRWKNSFEVSEIRLEASLETVIIFLKYLISRCIEEPSLTFEKIQKSILFADRYCLLDFMDELLLVLEQEMHIDYLSEICLLSNTIVNSRLDSILVKFLLDHLPFIYDSEILDLLSFEIFSKLNERVFEKYRDYRSKNFAAFENNNSEVNLADHFLQAATEYLSVFDCENKNLKEFSYSLKRPRRNVHKRTSECESQIQIDIPAISCNQILQQVASTHDCHKSDEEYVCSDKTNSLATPDKCKSDIDVIVQSDPVIINSGAVQTETFNMRPVSSWLVATYPSLGTSISLSEVIDEEKKRANKKIRKLPREKVIKNNKATDKCAWAKQDLNCNRLLLPQSLNRIQEDERNFDAILSLPKPSKAIHLVEIEERAILELEQYYREISEGTDIIISVNQIKERDNDFLNQSLSWFKTYKQKVESRN